VSSPARAASFGFRLLQGVLSPGRVSYAVFFLTDACNAKCPYCFNTRLSHLGGSPVGAGSLLSVAEYERIARNLDPLFQVVFSGGEPFLRPEIDQVAGAFYDHSSTRLFSIPTNGAHTRAVPEKIERMLVRCPRATFNINISLDAVGRRHDELRRLEGGFEKALAFAETLFGLRKRSGNLNVVVNTAVSDSNFDDVMPLKDFLGRRWAGERWFHNVQFDQRLEPARASGERAAEKRQILTRRTSSANTGFMKLVSRWYIEFIHWLIARQMDEDRMLYDCAAGRKMFVMTPDGKVSPCEPFLFERHYQRFPTFDIRDHGYDFYSIRKEPGFQEMEDFIHDRKCKACPWSCAAIVSMTYSPSNWRLLAAGSRL
jgi:radical SAM protein with 4Fe4S-binding SPASM domain